MVLHWTYVVNTSRGPAQISEVAITCVLLKKTYHTCQTQFWKKNQWFMQLVVCKSYLNSINNSSSIETHNAAVGWCILFVNNRNLQRSIFCTQRNWSERVGRVSELTAEWTKHNHRTYFGGLMIKPGYWLCRQNISTHTYMMAFILSRIYTIRLHFHSFVIFKTRVDNHSVSPFSIWPSMRDEIAA